MGEYLHRKVSPRADKATVRKNGATKILRDTLEYP